jgi:DNA-binding transcriptional LysR family regulator
MVPSALTYRVRQIEDALDVLLFDRSSRQARLTEAGHELLREGGRLLDEIDAVANRVRRVATGWEPQFTVAVDGVINRSTLLELCGASWRWRRPPACACATRCSGTLEALTSGQADLASAGRHRPAGAGCSPARWASCASSSRWRPTTRWPSRPSPSATPRCAHRAVAVADSTQRGGGVTSACWKGRTYSPCPICPPSSTPSCAAWRRLPARAHGPPLPRQRPAGGAPGRAPDPQLPAELRVAQVQGAKAIQWWLDQLDNPVTREACSPAGAAHEDHRRPRPWLEVLRSLDERRGQSLAELHAATGIPKPSLLRILDTLEASGFAWRAIGDGRYRRRFALILRPSLADELLAIGEIAAPFLEACAAR